MKRFDENQEKLIKEIGKLRLKWYFTFEHIPHW